MIFLNDLRERKKELVYRGMVDGGGQRERENLEPTCH